MADKPTINNIKATRDPLEILKHSKFIAQDLMDVFQDPNKQDLKPEHADILVRVTCRHLLSHFARMQSILESQNPTTK